MLEFRARALEKSASASVRRLHELVGIPIDAVRGGFNRAEIDTGERPGVTSPMHEELKRLRHENADLKRANGIFKSASASFAAAELDCGPKVIVAYIDAAKASFGVQWISRILTVHDFKVGARTYYAFTQSPPSVCHCSDQ